MHPVEITRVAQGNGRPMRTHRRWLDTRIHSALHDIHNPQGGREILGRDIALTFFVVARQFAEVSGHDKQSDPLPHSVLGFAIQPRVGDWLARLPYTHLSSAVCLLSFLYCPFSDVPLAHRQVFSPIP